MGRRMIAIGVMVSAFAVAPPALADYVPVGQQIRVSHTGNDLDTTRAAGLPDVAYNPDENEYLVVFYGNREPLVADPVNPEFEIFGQRLNSAGQEIGDEFQISTVGAAGDANIDALDPAVAYNPAQHLYLVAYRADPSDEEFEVYASTVEAQGNVVSTAFAGAVSAVGPAGDTNRDGFDPDVAYNSFNDDFLVTYNGNHASLSDDEILARKVDGNGVVTGGQLEISTPGSDLQDSFGSAVAYNSFANEFLVAYGRDAIAGLGDEFEIFGQRISGSTYADAGGDFQISQTGPPGDAAFDAQVPGLGYNRNGNEYLVAWGANPPPQAASETEVYGQRIGAGGGELGGSTDLRISQSGADGDASHIAGAPDVAFSTVQNEYLVTFAANPTGGPQEFEVYGQRMSAGGAELGGDLRISVMGADGDDSRAGLEDSAVYNPATDEYLVAWFGDNLAADNKAEVWARRLGSAPAAPGGSTQPGPQSTVPPETKKKKCRSAKKKGGGRSAKKRKCRRKRK